MTMIASTGSEFFASSDPYLGVGLAPHVRAVTFDDTSGRMVLKTAFGDEPTLYDHATGWSDPRFVDLVSAWVGNHGVVVTTLCEQVGEICPELKAEEVRQKADQLLHELAKVQALQWWYCPDKSADVPLCHIESGSRLYYTPLVIGAVPDGAEISRFAFVQRENGKTVLENCEIGVRLVLGPDGGGLLPYIFDGPHHGSDRNPSDEEKLVYPGFWHFLWRFGFLQSRSLDSFERQSWEFHERLFHARSRSFLGQRTIGATYQFKDKVPSPPAIKAPMSADKIALPRPDDYSSDAVPGHQSLYEVMDARKSIREPGARPLTLDGLGGFLWRTVATRKHIKGVELQDLLERPVPAGGAIHEIEIYLVINRCDGLKPGIYHYQGVEHALYALPAREQVRKAILGVACNATGLGSKLPDSLIVMASRMPRLGWKYQNLCYRLSLLNAGVMMEAFYLVATEMGLSPCATGSGDSALFALATGLGVEHETAIGEFILNGPPIKKSYH
ncbi:MULTISPECIES: SagB family peptide dehydrogenase [Thalassospira]|uniref:SagB family peptide dehydrogenase n=1 Tax=Thalassospira aquimaris TaxID=3037796 RepID=A0ABT6G7F2_9PROT|nr:MULTISPECIES: SagB family peptide dehydrogenase [Thalassospira]MDG4717982.1 SagB family peptide dehydrogenase [Thalassospira sp. FZY0004]